MTTSNPIDHVALVSLWNETLSQIEITFTRRDGRQFVHTFPASITPERSLVRLWYFLITQGWKFGKRYIFRSLTYNADADGVFAHRPIPTKTN